jgi:hypothetical protein
MTLNTPLLYAVHDDHGCVLAADLTEREAYGAACAIAARLRRDVALIRTHGPGAGVVPELRVTPMDTEAA